MLISEEYRRLNSELHRLNAEFGNESNMGAGPPIAGLAKGYEVKTVLDYGCGKGKLKAYLSGLGDPILDVREYDPAVPGKNTLPEPADLVVSLDMLEHVEPECLNDVLDHLYSLTKIVAFMTICLISSKKSLPDGRNAHLIVANEKFWLPRIASRWAVQLCTRTKYHLNVTGIP